ncbi:MAG: lytic transglycosylase domain-containing protein [Alphaproteobacteria bacterium]|nr:lytic transglycosylase domain-containing protein [Alphaproteobacteria bacterium]
MKHHIEKSARLERRRNAFGIAAFLCVFLSHWSWAGDNIPEIPLPAHKPENPAQTMEKSPGAAISVSLNGLMKKEKIASPFSASLSRKDAQLYKTLFKAQRDGDMRLADELMGKIHDKRLFGHVLYQRYMHDKYRSSFDELKDWLSRYGDHPNAEKLYRLALSRMPKDYKGDLPAPERVKEIVRVHEPTMHKARRYNSGGNKAGNDAARSRVFTLIRASRMQDALRQVDKDLSEKLIDTTEYDILRADIAAGFLYSGEPDRAASLAIKSAKRSGQYAPRAGWVAGLTAWRKGRYREAAGYFEITAHSPYASGWMQASAAYWVARAHMRLGNVREVSTWLERGTKYPRTFYGLISTRALGRDFDFNWNVPNFTLSYRNVLLAIPAGNRAIALVDSGQEMLAQAELLRTIPENQDQRNALLAYAGYANLPGLGMRIASAFSNPDEIYDAALYPLVPWRPQGGYKLDPAMAHAIMRQESRFDPDAESRSGAKGLMQLMPATARRVTKNTEPELDNPEVNLQIGQRYLEILLDDQAVQGDLFSLLIAYNAGPGNLAKWKKRWPDVKDPLLFIELIPSAETRAYVEYVLANYWIYRLREGQPLPSLDAIAAGQPAHYTEAAF